MFIRFDFRLLSDSYLCSPRTAIRAVLASRRFNDACDSVAGRGRVAYSYLYVSKVELDGNVYLRQVACARIGREVAVAVIESRDSSYVKLNVCRKAVRINVYVAGVSTAADSAVVDSRDTCNRIIITGVSFKSYVYVTAEHYVVDGAVIDSDEACLLACKRVHGVVGDSVAVTLQGAVERAYRSDLCALHIDIVGHGDDHAFEIGAAVDHVDDLISGEYAVRVRTRSKLVPSDLALNVEVEGQSLAAHAHNYFVHAVVENEEFLNGNGYDSLSLASFDLADSYVVAGDSGLSVSETVVVDTEFERSALFGISALVKNSLSLARVIPTYKSLFSSSFSSCV